MNPPSIQVIYFPVDFNYVVLPFVLHRILCGPLKIFFLKTFGSFLCRQKPAYTNVYDFSSASYRWEHCARYVAQEGTSSDGLCRWRVVVEPNKTRRNIYIHWREQYRLRLDPSVGLFCFCVSQVHRHGAQETTVEPFLYCDDIIFKINLSVYVYRSYESNATRLLILLLFRVLQLNARSIIQGG